MFREIHTTFGLMYLLLSTYVRAPETYQGPQMLALILHFEFSFCFQFSKPDNSVFKLAAANIIVK